MILYIIVRWIARTALDWYYRDIEVVGAERIPSGGPLILAVNHPNNVIDALVVLRIVPRRVRITAKATLWANPILRVAFRWYGVIPLRRIKDEPISTAANANPARNLDAFRAVLDTLEANHAILIFPEGISHSQSQLAPLRSGLARLALQARDERNIRGLAILPIGLVFERKWAPRTRILAHVGRPINVDEWQTSQLRKTPDAAREEPTPNRALGENGADKRSDAVSELTAEVDERLRATTVNFPTAEDAERVLGVARILAGVFDEPRPLEAPDRPLIDELDAIRRVTATRAALPANASFRAETFLARLEALREELGRRKIPVNDANIDIGTWPAARFALREMAIIAAAGPFAWWGRINHWLPLKGARAIAKRTSKTPEDPAMHTLVVGLILVLLAYAAQTALVWAWTGAFWAMLYLISLPAASTWHHRFQDRMGRALQRTRTYFQFRSDRTLQPRLKEELKWIREEALELEALAEGAVRG
ncbi:MAG: 1-acyl-sn-glycerol-3-phosphate acyltransferase [Anaerolineae bacterium]|nr:1-acyl-sn-glycerol-3-phosphate acyltransferase [Gemmatimonadaceae bacterium]